MNKNQENSRAERVLRIPGKGHIAVNNASCKAAWFLPPYQIRVELYCDHDLVWHVANYFAAFDSLQLVYAGEWFKFLDLTPWKGWRPTKVLILIVSTRKWCYDLNF